MLQVTMVSDGEEHGSTTREYFAIGSDGKPPCHSVRKPRQGGIFPRFDKLYKCGTHHFSGPSNLHSMHEDRNYLSPATRFDMLPDCSYSGATFVRTRCFKSSDLLRRISVWRRFKIWLLAVAMVVRQQWVTAAVSRNLWRPTSEGLCLPRSVSVCTCTMHGDVGMAD